MQNILGFTVWKLPISYLGLPIIGKKTSYSQCWKLIQPIENLMFRWKGKCLSLIWRKYSAGQRDNSREIYLLHIYAHSAQGICLPDTVHGKVKKLAYDGRKGIPWSRIVLPKNEGGLGVRNLEKVAEAIPIKNEANFWAIHPSILSTWMKHRYIKSKALLDIVLKPTIYSAQWMEP